MNRNDDFLLATINKYTHQLQSKFKPPHKHIQNKSLRVFCSQNSIKRKATIDRINCGVGRYSNTVADLVNDGG